MLHRGDVPPGLRLLLGWPGWTFLRGMVVREGWDCAFEADGPSAPTVFVFSGFPFGSLKWRIN